MDFPQNSVPLMTPPISPAMVNRDSVINQGPMAGRPQGSCTPLQSHIPCQAFSDVAYQNVPPTNPSFFSSAPNYQALFRPQTHAASYPSRPDRGRYPPFCEQQPQQLPKDYFTPSCAETSYISRPPANFGSAPESMMEAQGLQLLDPGGYGFLGGSGICQGTAYPTSGE